MKICFLGTGHGVPTASRSCSSTLIEVGGDVYYIDGGAPIVDRTLLSGRELTDARAFFITHTHGDHVNGIFHFADLINWRYRDASIEIYTPEENFGVALSELISITSKPIDSERIRFKTAKAGMVYEDENIRVSYIPTKHMESVDRPSYAILVEGEGKRILFSGDLSQRLERSDFPPAAYEELDLFVLELAHFGIDELACHFPNIGAKMVAFSHVSPVAKYDDIESIKNKYAFEVLTPSDMEEFEI